MYQIHLDQFEGPLDLLLFFIRRDELDIYDIPIARLADEYLAYVRVLEEIDLDGVGDFLYMAALLISIKARMLLPRQEVDDDGEIIDPRRELVERLLEYVRYKEASQALAEKREDRAQHYLRRDEQDLLQPQRPATLQPATVFDLIEALRRVLTEAPSTPRHHVEQEAYSIEAQRDYVRAQLREQGRITFVSLVAGHAKPFIITTFLALLEMTRQGEVNLRIASGALDFFVEVRPDEADEHTPADADRTDS